MCASVDVCMTQFVFGSSQNRIQNSKLGKVNWALPQVSSINWITDACPQCCTDLQGLVRFSDQRCCGRYSIQSCKAVSNLDCAKFISFTARLTVVCTSSDDDHLVLFPTRLRMCSAHLKVGMLLLYCN